MVSQSDKKHFIKRINDLKCHKIAEINTAYPSSPISITDAIIKGSAPLRKKSDIIASINGRMDKGRYYGELPLSEVFDTSELETRNKVINKDNEKIRDLLKDRLEKRVTHILDMLHFGDNSDLLNILTTLEKEDFTVLK